MLAREVIAIPVALMSLLFLSLAFAFPFVLIEQSKKDAHRLIELRAVQAYLDKSLLSQGSIPTDDLLRAWAEDNGLELASSVSTNPLACLNNLQKSPQDRYLVGFWVGEWSECMSSPSGATTLRPTALSLLTSGLWIDLALYLTLGVSLGWVALMLGVRRRWNGSLPPNYRG